MALELAFPQGPIPPGQRIAAFGGAGSGKSYLTKWAILRSSGYRWIVLDTKHDPIFNAWNPKNGLQTMDQLARLWRDNPRIVVRPKPFQTTAAVLDAYLADLHDGFDSFGCAIDETYQVAFGPRAGPGLTGLVTRGRVRRQSVIMGSQRPAWVPRFVFSEANGYVIMNLNLMKDKQTVYDMVGDKRVLERVEPRHWLYYNVGDDELTAYGPTTIT